MSPLRVRKRIVEGVATARSHPLLRRLLESEPDPLRRAMTPDDEGLIDPSRAVEMAQRNARFPRGASA